MKQHTKVTNTAGGESVPYILFLSEQVIARARKERADTEFVAYAMFDWIMDQVVLESIAQSRLAHLNMKLYTMCRGNAQGLVGSHTIPGSTM